MKPKPKYLRGWTKGQFFRLIQYAARKEKVKAIGWLRGGLAVGEYNAAAGRFNVTHVGSGLLVRSEKTSAADLRTAILNANRLLKICDWTKPGKTGSKRRKEIGEMVAKEFGP